MDKRKQKMVKHYARAIEYFKLVTRHMFADGNPVLPKECRVSKAAIRKLQKRLNGGA